MYSFGVCLNSLAPSQTAFYAISNANKLLESRRDVDFTIFYENLSQACINPNFSVQGLIEAYTFRGILIATHLATAVKIATFPAHNSPKLFYVQDLEWNRFQPRQQYESLAGIYRDERLQLVARSESHANILENCFNRKVAGIVDDWKYEDFIKIVR